MICHLFVSPAFLPRFRRDSAASAAESRRICGSSVAESCKEELRKKTILFRFEVALHQLIDGLEGVFIFVQNEIHLFHDWHFHTLLLSEF